MKFTENFRTDFEKNLKQRKDVLKKETLAFVKANMTSPYRCIFGYICIENFPFKLDYKTIEKLVEMAFEESTIFNLQLRNSYSYMHSTFYNNEIKFSIPITFPRSFDDHYYDSKSNITDLNYDSESEYWKESKNIDCYKVISDFPCYLDIKFPNTELKKYKEIGDIINTDAWLKYLRDLLNIFFPEFIYSENYSTKKMIRFVKPLTDSISLGFEYDESFLRKKYEQGDLEFPEYFNLILINNNFKKNIKKEEYIFKYNENIMSLGILGHPVFFSGCLNISRYIYTDMIYERDNPKNTTFKYFREYRKISENEIQIVHTKGIGEKVKKHAFLYMDLLSTSSKYYLYYLEENIIKSRG